MDRDIVVDGLSRIGTVVKVLKFELKKRINTDSTSMKLSPFKFGIFAKLNAVLFSSNIDYMLLLPPQVTA